MKKYSIYFLLLFLSHTAVSGELPTKYYLTGNSSVMSIAMRADVEWQEKLDGRNLEIIISGRFQDFVIKRIWYNFKEGAIASFAMEPVHPDTEKIVIALRQNSECKIYQNKETKRFIIELITGRAPAVSVAARTKAVSNKEKSNVTPPINIAKIAQKQVEENTESTKKEASEIIIPAKIESTYSQEDRSSAWLLIISSVVVFAGGGGVLAFIYVNRKRIPLPLKKQYDAKNVKFDSGFSLPHNIVVDESEDDFEHSIEFAENYLRTQGELDLQERLQNLTNTSRHRKIENLSFGNQKRKNDKVKTAQQLGITIGELDLAARLQKFQQQHVEEAV